MTPTTGLSSETEWSLPQKWLFRFSFIFFSLYIIPFPGNCIPVIKDNLGWIFESWNWLVVNTGKYILHLSYDITVLPNGSGDTTWNWVQILIMASVAFTGSLIWSLLDRRRNNYQHLLYWFTVGVRYYLAFMLVNYGTIKVFKAQFPAPDVYRLEETYGQSSPMGLAWTFLGFSTGYNYFMGLAEVTGGLLLLIRRTKTFGALFCMTVTANIAAINYFFDVPVKIFSTMLLLMAVFITAPDIERLIQFFILNRSSRLKSYVPLYKSGKWKFVFVLVKAVFIASVLYNYTELAIEAREKYGDDTAKPKLYGNYRVEAFYKDSVVIPPLAADKTRWKKILLGNFDRGAVQMMNDTLNTYTYHDNFDSNEISFTTRSTDELKYQFKYSQIDKEHIEMKSESPDGSIYMKLVRMEPDEYLLMKRGFHWISEYPFNR